MAESLSSTKLQSARKRLRYIFIAAAIGWLCMSAFLPPIIIFSLLDVGLFFMIWHGSSFAKFLTVPMFLIRGVLCLLPTLFGIAATMSGPLDSGPAFFAAMLPGFLAFTLYSLGAGVALLFVPNIAQIQESEAFSAKMRARMAIADARLAARAAHVDSQEEGDNQIGIPGDSDELKN